MSIDSNAYNHHAPLRKKVSPYVSKRYHKTIGRLLKLLKLNGNKIPEDKYHLKIILHATSDAEEQYAILRIFYKQAGYKLPKTKPHRWLTEDEKEQIITMFFKFKMPKLKIAKELGRPDSTIHYFIKRYMEQNL